LKLLFPTPFRFPKRKHAAQEKDKNRQRGDELLLPWPNNASKHKVHCPLLDFQSQFCQVFMDIICHNLTLHPNSNPNPILHQFLATHLRILQFCCKTKFMLTSTFPLKGPYLLSSLQAHCISDPPPGVGILNKFLMIMYLVRIWTSLKGTNQLENGNVIFTRKTAALSGVDDLYIFITSCWSQFCCLLADLYIGDWCCVQTVARLPGPLPSHKCLWTTSIQL
jgi:hypothetical protein